ncbi:MAG: metal-sensitive transcriptional regulator [Armatimonadetes bacterium]|nr:metal-sensitive transcriptional regulator [Armatimonadota bacterium]
MKNETANTAKKRLNRVTGQINGLQRMIDNARPCSELLQQYYAARAALDQVGVLLLSEHIQTCVLQQESDGNGCAQFEDAEQTEEIKAALRRFLH